MKLNILLSTYNGEAFLKEQIKSIQAQTYQDWNLLIRDDGSTDQTPRIIQEFVKSDPRIRWINPEDVQNLGVIQSFLTLLKYEVADFYCFSDQDDIWLPEKLALQLKEAKKYSSDRALLVYTDLKIVNHDLRVLHESMIKTQSDHANTTLLQELTENTVTGGVTLINHCLANLWTGKESQGLLMHDWYLGLLAATFGELIYLDQPTELYRQHLNNVLGARTLRKRLQNWLRPHVLFEKYWQLIESSQKQAKNLLVFDLTASQRQLIEDFVTILDQPLKERYRRLKTYGYRKNRAFHTFVFRSLILTKFMYKEK